MSDVEPPSQIEKDDMRRLLIYLGAARNVIEHNKSVVNAEFITLVPDSSHSIGDRVVIGSTELGDALFTVERTADDLNRRAVEKFAMVNRFWLPSGSEINGIKSNPRRR